MKQSSILIITIIFLLQSCSKLLDEKPNQEVRTLTSADDLQALLYNESVMNKYTIDYRLAGCDEYTLSSSAFSGAPVNSRNSYIWNDDADYAGSWEINYISIAVCNTVLQELEKIKASAEQRVILTGQSKFFRASAFFNLSEQYCRPYTSSAAADLGLPLRLTGNAEEKISRSTLAQTYDLILKDLSEAVPLLPEKASTPNVPSKQACYGLLSRIYLSMANYDSAELYANKYLDISSELIDFNTRVSAVPSFTINNAEVSFLSYVDGAVLKGIYPVTINPNLINSYDAADLRKSVYFRYSIDSIATFKGSYFGDYWDESMFTGIATDEIYFIRAECRARKEDIDGAMKDVNDLLLKRWETGTFLPYNVASKEVAINIIMQEKKKELVFRGTLWSDLRRWNLEGANITLSRNIDGTIYTLPPNDKRWVWLVPNRVINLSGIQQNER